MNTMFNKREGINAVGRFFYPVLRHMLVLILPFFLEKTKFYYQLYYLQTGAKSWKNESLFSTQR
jgi:hypothetical protein